MLPPHTVTAGVLFLYFFFGVQPEITSFTFFSPELSFKGPVPTGSDLAAVRLAV